MVNSLQQITFGAAAGLPEQPSPDQENPWFADA